MKISLQAIACGFGVSLLLLLFNITSDDLCCRISYSAIMHRAAIAVELPEIKLSPLFSLDSRWTRYGWFRRMLTVKRKKARPILAATLRGNMFAALPSFHQCLKPHGFRSQWRRLRCGRSKWVIDSNCIYNIHQCQLLIKIDISIFISDESSEIKAN